MVRLIHVQAVSLIASRNDRSVEMLISLDYDAPISINESGVVFLKLKNRMLTTHHNKQLSGRTGLHKADKFTDLSSLDE